MGGGGGAVGVVVTNPLLRGFDIFRLGAGGEGGEAEIALSVFKFLFKGITQQFWNFSLNYFNKKKKHFYALNLCLLNQFAFTATDF